MNSGIMPNFSRSSGMTSAKALASAISFLLVRASMTFSRPAKAPPTMNSTFVVSIWMNSWCGCLRPPCGGTDAVVKGKREVDTINIFGEVMPEDLLKFGMIPEFIGRLPVITSVQKLDREALINILTEPKNALVRQYRKLFELDGVELEFTDDALEAIADQAILRGTGARGLRAIMEEVLQSVMYDIPSREDVASVVITKEVVLEHVNPTIVPRKPTRAPREKSA